MKRTRRASLRGQTAMAALAALALAWLGACITAPTATDLEWLDGTHTRAAGPALRVRWTRDLAPPFSGKYVPVERAAAALDPEGARVYIGSNQGVLWALRQDGAPLFKHTTNAGIEAAPAVDGARDEVYLATTRGEVQRLDADSGTVRWKAQAGGAVSAAPLLTGDAVYVVTDEDQMIALARKDGSVLWRYRREAREGLAIEGHAGLTRTPRGIVTGFEDGAVVMLDAGDGRVLWELDTSDEFGDAESNFIDVDTTPALVGDVVYVASFTAGAYALDVAGGGVQWHEPKLTGVTHVAATDDLVLFASAQRGIVCLDRATYAARWVQGPERGAPGAIHIEHGIAYAAETLGALRAFALSNGRELGRLETAHGITSPPSLERGQGYVLSNAGRLFAVAY